jgi:L-histidine N-alpha-methyltransferase
MHGATHPIETLRDDDVRVLRMAEEIREGLTARPRRLPSKYFYDDRGSRLFEAITALPEYYQTRTEERLLTAVAADVVRRVRPTELVELGSGSGRKTRLLLEVMRAAGRARGCLLLDINPHVVAASAHAIAAEFPGLTVRGMAGDFLDDLFRIGPGGGRLAVFFGGTIGNLHPAGVPAFLAGVAAQLTPGDGFLVGLDLVKDVARLEAAYNDGAGVTAAFNRNILRVLNARLGGDFDPDAYAHVAFYDRERAWIEMRLRSTRLQRVRLPAARLELALEAGEEIRTEISCKYTRASFEALLRGTGLRLDRWYTDPEELFALALLAPNDGVEEMSR